MIEPISAAIASAAAGYTTDLAASWTKTALTKITDITTGRLKRKDADVDLLLAAKSDPEELEALAQRIQSLLADDADYRADMEGYTGQRIQIDQSVNHFHGTVNQMQISGDNHAPMFGGQPNDVAKELCGKPGPCVYISRRRSPRPERAADRLWARISPFPNPAGSIPSSVPRPRSVRWRSRNAVSNVRTTWFQPRIDPRSHEPWFLEIVTWDGKHVVVGTVLRRCSTFALFSSYDECMSLFQSNEISLQTGHRQCVLDITDKCRRFLVDFDAYSGLLNIFVPHATAGVAILETGAGSDDDLLASLEDLLPRDDRWQHRHGSYGHGRDHVLPAYIAPHATIPVIDGRMALGTWQSVTLVDTNVDNPDRRVRLSYLG